MEAWSQWPKIKEIVGAALEKEPSDRGAFLDEACSHNEDLRQEIDSLLMAYEEAGGLSEGPWKTEAAAPVRAAQTIGNYRLMRELGVGGMGQVWLAEQTAPVSRQCALKLIKGGIYDADAVRRFQAERQSLASMDHPAIAKVFDAGTTSVGQPYFAMEYVDGLPINEYCNRERLGLRERLRLFLQVCEGVQHAHQKAIIHRDLKPSNILVITVDGRPRPRIIDFGLAKTVETRPAGETLYTQIGALLGTPGYMSPEQIDPHVHDIDTRSDVYSLGVVLYELLTGVLPFDTSRFKRQHLDEMLRELRSEVTVRPSSRVSMNRETLASRAVDRATDDRTLPRLLRGDLDSITMKALEKERDRRYGTATELAADIERHLDDLPVLAGKASAGYRLLKYARRHRIALLAGSSALLLIVLFAVMQAVQLRRITRERDRADRISNFMTNMFQVPDPSESRGTTVTAREILDRSSAQIEGDLSQDGQTRAQLMEVMARTYANLGLYTRAHHLAELCLKARQSLLGKDDPKTLESMTQMSFILYREGHDQEAEKLIRSAIDLEQRRLGPEDPRTIEAKQRLAYILGREGRFAEQEKLQREVAALLTRKFGPQDLRTVQSEDDVTDALRGESRFQEAEERDRRSIEIKQRTIGANHPSTIASMNNLANVLEDEEQYDAAEAQYRKTIAISEKVLGPEHSETISTTIALANDIVQDEARWPEAEQLYRKAVEAGLRNGGREAWNTTQAEEALANLLSNEKHHAEAERLLKEVAEVRLRLLGPNHTDTLLVHYNLAIVYLHEHRLAEAEKLLRETVASQVQLLGAENADALASTSSLGEVLRLEGRPAEGEELDRRALTIQERVLGPAHSDTLQSVRHLGLALVDLHRYQEMEQMYSDTIAAIAAVKDGDTSSAWYDYARVTAQAGHRKEAIDRLNKAIEAGYRSTQSIRTEDDFKPLLGDRRFAEAASAAQKAKPGSVR